jgi:hypothetical protein
VAAVLDVHLVHRTHGHELHVDLEDSPLSGSNGSHTVADRLCTGKHLCGGQSTSLVVCEETLMRRTLSKKFPRAKMLGFGIDHSVVIGIYSDDDAGVVYLTHEPSALRNVAQLRMGIGNVFLLHEIARYAKHTFDAGGGVSLETVRRQVEHIYALTSFIWATDDVARNSKSGPIDSVPIDYDDPDDPYQGALR